MLLLRIATAHDSINAGGNTMFNVALTDIQSILNDFSITEKPGSFSELQRYDYEKNGENSKEVRLIIKVDFEDRSPVVIRFKNEKNVTEDIVEKQCGFAENLFEKGISTPHNYRSDGHFAIPYHLNGYDVIVTAEDFCEGEVKAVDEKTAYMTGELLARMHNISECENLHLNMRTLFDPLGRNDLFDISVFAENRERLRKTAPALYDETEKIKDSYMEKIAVFGNEPRYAVQGDISDCNLYITESGQLGVFDFNNSGDNVLFYDAAMQAVFEATLMDYKEVSSPERERNILSAFLTGYESQRPFTVEQRNTFPYLYAILTAFEAGKMCYNEGNLESLIKENRNDDIRECLKCMRDCLLDLKKPEILFGRVIL